MRQYFFRATLVMTMIGAAAFGCVGGSKSKVNKEALKQYILAAAPGDIPNKLDTVFEGKAKLLGYRVQPENKQVKPGDTVTITMYWECLDKIADGWGLFTHVLDANGQRMLHLDNVGPLRSWVDSRQVLGPDTWEKGKIYVDQQVFTVPEELDTSELVFATGIWKGDARLKVVSGSSDRENRAIVVRLTTPKAPTVAGKRDEIKALQVPRLLKTDKITIDGKLSEPAWERAATTGAFIDVGNGKPNPSFPVQGAAKLLWDEKYLYVAFEVTSNDIVGGFSKDVKNPRLWEKDTIEIMIDPDGDGDNKDYYEIQINPQNLVFDTQYDDYNQPKDDAKGEFGHMDWESKVNSAVIVDGEMDKPGAGKGYVVEARIPWASFTKAHKSPPATGDTWRMNFYAMKSNSGVAWSPILGQGNFHKASRFGRVTWVDVVSPQLPDEKPSEPAAADPKPAESSDPGTPAPGKPAPVAPGMPAPGKPAPVAPGTPAPGKPAP